MNKTTVIGWLVGTAPVAGLVYVNRQSTPNRMDLYHKTNRPSHFEERDPNVSSGSAGAPCMRRGMER
jgi:hypothetical protein